VGRGTSAFPKTPPPLGLRVSRLRQFGPRPGVPHTLNQIYATDWSLQPPDTLAELRGHFAAEERKERERGKEAREGILSNKNPGHGPDLSYSKTC